MLSRSLSVQPRMRTRTTFFPLVVVLCACSDAPRSVPIAGASSPKASASRELPPGHPTLPADHPPVGPAVTVHAAPNKPAEDPSIVFSGSARLVGPLRDAKTGFVFVSVRPKGQIGPLLTYRIDLADPDLREPVLVAHADGTRELNFILNQRTSLMPSDVPRDIALELQLLYDPDGDIDTKAGRHETVVPTVIGREHALELPANP